MTKTADRTGGTAAPRQQETARPQEAARKAATAAPTNSLLLLQRSIGNQATVEVLRRQALIRREVEEGLTQSSGTLENLSGQVSTFSSMGGIEGNVYQQGNVNTPGATGGEVGSVGGGLASLGSMVLSSKSAVESAQTRKEEEKTGHKGQGTWKEADRSHGMSTANALQSAGNVVAAGLSSTANVSQILANSGATSVFAASNNALGAAGGAVALPVQVVNTIRTIRKAHKQYGRLVKLRAGLDDPKTKESEAAKALQTQLDYLTESQALRDTAGEELAAARNTRDGLKKGTSKRLAAQARVNDLRDAHGALVAQVQDAVDERDRLQQAKDAATLAITEAAERVKTGQENPTDIRVYAMQKSKAGFTKKIISTVGGILGIGGGIAATVASIAAVGATAVVGVAVMATPVGWALCGAAALIGLAMGGYAFWKWASKKYERARAEGMTKGQAFLTAINPFKKVGQSRRERNAQRLYKYARGTDPDTGAPASGTDVAEAKAVLLALGLDYGALKLDDDRHEPAALKLIQAKLGS